MIDNSVFENKKVAFHTFGCKLNFSETSTVARTMVEAGFAKVDISEPADVYLFNTCSVTELADKKCKQVIRKAIKQNPNAFIVVTGCFAQLKPEDVSKIEGVDLVLGSNEKFDILQYIEDFKKGSGAEVHAGKIGKNKEFKPSYSFGDRTRCFLKVQDGCDYFCSYCTIPFARGRSRSDTIANTIEQAKKAAEGGAKEIILTGVNIGDFGKGTDENFFQLIQHLEKVEGIKRFRISSIEPNLLTDEIIAFVAASKKFMPHFHIPLQSGSDKVLKLMKRKYDTQLFRTKIERIKELIPHAFIGVDVIVGVRGESEEEFSATHQFLADLDVSQLHVFTYSERPNTQALKIDEVVPIPVRKERSKILHELSEKKTRHFYKAYIGEEMPVLFEGAEHGGLINGFTPNYIKVEVPYDFELSNSIKDVKLKHLSLDTLNMTGQLI
ncbi:tRNA (N(6)-L-threonylcarbamoyladenosine(37)-C(2))-methylthiotransferase MtaB [Carboxylicivirga sediminis]|uniref:tRNA (N(6)-L-threonylcarbamoyladenosine(37)-C(2))-methylthiotransferase MtaB n=1 Tax=Carboxylicivirga sediminis TaxID=2006564 RepID=A0A941F4R7_9BACT|nr:tRNA (N(6)-L-threonylcarbamoyladenosine(37)-C(2))-methylthiotransferase MtaB [Carboxylicivirga sediminis]MBR8536786.1 tRNA (N(6)-L-threonylcarbamoyladenosine(37)-C(2))-methylthiotransferase MtaB [Carboxylicivirga sediminis]